MADFGYELDVFWNNHPPQPKDHWRISTEIISHGDKRWVRASIIYLATPVINAHSDDFDPQDTITAEQQAIMRAIEMMPKKGKSG
jgi:hypothetical protein